MADSPSPISEFSPSAPQLSAESSFDNDDGVAPSAPPPEYPFENPVTQDSTTACEWAEIGRTESILNNLNPEWKAKFLIDYRFEEKQLLTFMVFDKDCKKYSLDNHDFLGTLECSLGEIVSAPHSKLTRPLRVPSIHCTTETASTLSVIAEEAGDCKKFVNFTIRYTSQREKPVSSVSRFKPSATKKFFVNISKQISDGSWNLLHRTERREWPATGALTFSPVNLRYSALCRKGNLEMPLRFQIHQVKYSFRGKSAKPFAEMHTNFIEISDRLKKEPSMNLPTSDKDITCNIFDYKIEQQRTFVDYLHDGLDIKFAVAIDFTASNGEPTSHSSLHYKHGKRDNPYVTTLKIVGEILEDYSVSKEFYGYGFGAKGYPVANRVNHKFSLNFKETNPLCQGIDGVLASYSRALQRVKLFGPTCFAPVIREVTEIAKNRCSDSDNSEYYVLLILTDGIVCDPETTMDAIVEASELPISVIIIGIGDEDFSIMEKFDSDEKLLKSRSGKPAQRDIVQFVELKKFVNFKSIRPISEGSKAALARSVLAELPQQVVSWMNFKRQQKSY